MSRFLIVVIFFGAFSNVTAQHFVAEATVPTVDVDGFYRIFLSPQLTPFWNAQLSNIRVFDSQNKEVPYLFQEELPAYSKKQFREYKIVSKKQDAGCCTTIILESPERTPINNISLLIRNAAVKKEVILSGSDDQQQWFAIKEKFTIHSVENSSGTTEMKVVEFPLSNYQYYSLQMSDSGSNPLNIIKAGYYDVLTSSGSYTEVPVRNIITSDTSSLKRTYVQMFFDTLQLLDKLELTMTGMPHFLRKATVYEIQKMKSNKDTFSYYREITSFNVSSTHASIIQLPEVKTNKLMVMVENEDNPSITVASAKAYQLNRYLVTWLKKNAAYKIKFATAALPLPGYDINYFQKDIPEQSTVLNVVKVNILKQDDKQVSPVFFTSRSIIWIAIVIVIAVLGFMSVRLMKEAGTAGKNE